MKGKRPRAPITGWRSDHVPGAGKRWAGSVINAQVRHLYNHGGGFIIRPHLGADEKGRPKLFCAQIKNLFAGEDLTTHHIRTKVCSPCFPLHPSAPLGRSRHGATSRVIPVQPLWKPYGSPTRPPPPSNKRRTLSARCSLLTAVETVCFRQRASSNEPAFQGLPARPPDSAPCPR